MDKFDLILLSFPRSGSTWLRYILEYAGYKFTRPYSGFDAPRYRAQACLEKGVALKSHGLRDRDKAHKNVVIVRNPVEVVIRYDVTKSGFQRFKELTSDTKHYRPGHTDYIRILNNYEEMSDKHFIYYEDLVQKPEDVIYDLLTYVGCDSKERGRFLYDLKKHTRASIDGYSDADKKSFTKGKDIKFHRKEIGEEEYNKWMNHLKEKYPTLYNKYLLRYEEY